MAKDAITGRWNWDPYSGYEPKKSPNGSIVTAKITKGASKGESYFGIVHGFNGFQEPSQWKGVYLQGYADSNKNGKFDMRIDKRLGKSGEIKANTSFAGDPSFSGTFRADTGTGLAKGFFESNEFAAVAEKIGFWFV